MQQINFNPLDFSVIPQAIQQANQQQYAAQRGILDAIGHGAEKVGGAIDEWEQKKLADEWKKRQWEHQLANELYSRNYQRGRDRIMDTRYNDEIARREEGERQSREAAARLRQEFLSRTNDQDLSKYGPGAQFAMSRIQNARDWNDIVSGGESLANIIQYRDALEAQQGERMAAQAEQERQMAGPRLSQQIGSSMAASGLDLGNLNSVYSATPRSSRQSTLDQLKGYRDQLIDFQNQYPGMLTPEMQKQLNELNNAIRVWGRKMNTRPVRF